jgi:hypothetical protein
VRHVDRSPVASVEACAWLTDEVDDDGSLELTANGAETCDVSS